MAQEMLRRIVKISRNGVKTDPRATSRTMNTPISTRVVMLKLSRPLELTRSATEAVAPPTSKVDEASSGLWARRVLRLFLMRLSVSMAGSEYGSLEGGAPNQGGVAGLA